MSDIDEKAKTMLILKYGSIPNAYEAYKKMSPTELARMTDEEFDVIIEYEHCNSFPWTSHCRQY